MQTSFVVAVPVVEAASTAAAAAGCGGAEVTVLNSCSNLTHYIQMFLHQQ